MKKPLVKPIVKRPHMIMKRPLVVPIVFFLAGVILPDLFKISLAIKIIPAFFAALFFAVFLFMVSFKSQKFFYLVLCLVFLFLGFFRYASAMSPAENDITEYISGEKQETVLYGTVTGYPEWKKSRFASYRAFSFNIYKLLSEDEENDVTGSALVKLFSSDKNPRIGDRLIIGGKISIPRGTRNPAPRDTRDATDFDYKKYLSRKGIRAVFYSRKRDHYLKTGVSKSVPLLIQRFLFDMRDRADRTIRLYLTWTPRAVTESVILGLRSGITDDLRDTFIKTGTMHILAVSGLHIGIVGFVLMGFLRLVRCPRKASYYFTIAGICLFAVFAGARPSSIRAALMGTFVLISLATERKTDIVNALTLSAFFIVFFRPGQVFQAGFILSYIAVLSIIYATPLTDAFLNVPKRWYGESRIAFIKRSLLKSLSISLAIWAGMIPVIAGYFGIITPSVVLSNLLAVPVLFLLVVLGFFLMLTGSFMILSSVTGIIALCLRWIVRFFVGTMELLSQIPFSHIRVPSPKVFLILGYYLMLIGIIALFHRYKQY